MMSLSPVAQRLIALGLLALVLLFSYLYIALPLWTYYAERIDRIDRLERQSRQYLFLINNEQEITSELARVEGGDTGGDLFLAGINQAIASANMRESVSDAVKDTGGQLISSEEYEAEPIEATSAVALQVQVRGEVQDLVSLIHQIETSRPAMFIEELEITARSQRGSSSRDLRRTKVQQASGGMDIRINLVGYMLNTGSTRNTDEQ